MYPIPEIDSIIKVNDKTLNINDVRFFERILVWENLSMASKFANERAFLFVILAVNIWKTTIKGIKIINQRYAGFENVKLIPFPSFLISLKTKW